MKKLKKILSLILALSLIMSGLSGLTIVSASDEGIKTIDFRPDLNGGGYGCGSGGEHARLQTFRTDSDGVLEKIRLILNSNEQSSNETMKLGDLRVGIYEMDTDAWVTSGDETRS